MKKTRKLNKIKVNFYYLILIILSVTFSLISFWGDGKSIFSIKKKAQAPIKITNANFIIDLMNELEFLALGCNLGCIVIKYI